MLNQYLNYMNNDYELYDKIITGKILQSKTTFLNYMNNDYELYDKNITGKILQSKTTFLNMFYPSSFFSICGCRIVCPND